MKGTEIMNFKKKIREFCTLTRRGDGGFTLVELIVVIAILAILGGIAIPAYSGYITKANKQADITLVSQVANALTLQYYVEVNGETKTDYVILTTDGAEAKNQLAQSAMEATFGANWAESAALKYAGWTNDDLVSLVAEYSDDDLAAIAGSTYLGEKSSPQALMTAVTDLTGIVSNAISANITDPDEAVNKLNTLLGDGNSLASNLSNMKFDTSTEAGMQEYSTAISNMLVSYMAGNMDNAGGLSYVMNMYASAVAYAQESGDEAVLNVMQNKLSTVGQSGGIALNTLYELNSDEDCWALFIPEDGSCDAYFEKYVSADNSKYVSDQQALHAMMGAVEKIAGGYTKQSDLTNPDLFSSGAVSDQINNYINTVKALSGMDSDMREQLKNVPDNAVVVFIANTGEVSATPAAAWLKP